jgi:3-oxoadipate enol-lactonase
MKNRPDSSDLLPRVACPALVIAGLEDILIPVAESEAMHSAIPRAQFVKLTGAGHLSNMETPDEFSEAVTNFLRSSLRAP